MSFRPRSLILTLASIFSGANIPGGRRYIVSTNKERHTRHPRMEHKHSRAKAAKRNRNKIKRRSHKV